MRNIINKKFNIKKISAILAGVITLTSFAGCNNSKNNTESTTYNPTTKTTVTSEEVEEVVIKKRVVVNKDYADENYMIHAKAVAKAMYDSNKAYFDEKDFTVEDLENVYYALNGKYYDNESNLIMNQQELDRSFDVIRELVAPQRINEMLQKYKDLENGVITYEEYMNEVNASEFYDYRVSLANFIDVNEDNKDIKNFVTEYSKEMVKVTENVKNGVSPEEHLTEFFAIVRSAQTGNKTDFANINTYLQETNTDDGYGFIVAGIYKSTADYLNTVIDGTFVKVQNENVRIGLSYDERILLNTYYLGDLVEYDDIYRAKKLEAELFQTMPLMVMCDKQEKITRNFGYEVIDNNAHTL